MELKLPVYCVLRTSQGVSVPSDIVSSTSASVSSDAGSCVAPACTAAAFSEVTASCPAASLPGAAAFWLSSALPGTAASCPASVFSDTAVFWALLPLSCFGAQEAHSTAHKRARQIAAGAFLVTGFSCGCIFLISFFILYTSQ